MSGKRESRKTGLTEREETEINALLRQNQWLAVGLAHDLNTIITTIYGYGEIALGSLDEGSESAMSIRQIIKAADKARILTGRLMDLSITRDPEIINVRLGDIITETVSLVRPAVPSGTEIIVNLPIHDVYVSADPVQLLRAFLNLAVNALQAMETTGGSLTITLQMNDAGGHADPSEGRFAIVRFADTGKGMDSRTADRMFEPFFTEGKEGRGRGIGLSLVHDTITGIGGEIKVTAAVSKGTVIDISVPAVSADRASIK